MPPTFYRVRAWSILFIRARIVAQFKEWHRLRLHTQVRENAIFAIHHKSCSEADAQQANGGSLS